MKFDLKVSNLMCSNLINGKSYEWADIVVNVLGVPIIGITNIEYEEKQGMENIYGAVSNFMLIRYVFYRI